MRTEDGYIINKCLEGETEAFAFLVDKYKTSVYAFAYSKVHNFHDAEDITQEVFVKAYKKLPNLKHWDSFRAWLYIITSNECKALLRSRSSRPDQAFVEDQDPKSLANLSINSYRESFLYETLKDAIDSLPEMYSQVLVMHYFGGMKNRDIAVFLGASIDNIKQRLSRARALLRKDVLAMMTVYEQKKLPANFTFNIVEIVKRICIHPVTQIKGLPYSLPLATSIIIAILSLNPLIRFNQLSVYDGSPLFSEAKVLNVGEIPVDVMEISSIPILLNQSGKGNGGSKSPNAEDIFFAAQTQSSVRNKNEENTESMQIYDILEGIKATRKKIASIKLQVLYKEDRFLPVITEEEANTRIEEDIKQITQRFLELPLAVQKRPDYLSNYEKNIRLYRKFMPKELTEGHPVREELDVALKIANCSSEIEETSWAYRITQKDLREYSDAEEKEYFSGGYIINALSDGKDHKIEPIVSFVPYGSDSSSYSFDQLLWYFVKQCVEIDQIDLQKANIKNLAHLAGNTNEYEISYQMNNSKTRKVITVDINKDFSVKKAEWYESSEIRQPYVVVEFLDYDRSDAGIWFPKKIRSVGYLSKGSVSKEVSNICEWSFKEVLFNLDFPQNYFK